MSLRGSIGRVAMTTEDGRSSMFDELVVTIYGLFLPENRSIIGHEKRRMYVDHLCLMASTSKFNLAHKFESLMVITDELVEAAAQKNQNALAALAFPTRFCEVLQPLIDNSILSFICSICMFDETTQNILREYLTSAVNCSTSRNLNLEIDEKILHMFDPFSALQGMAVWKHLLRSTCILGNDSEHNIETAVMHIRTALTIHWFIRESLVDVYSYSVPSISALEWIQNRSYAKIVSFGSGNAYWEHCISARNSQDDTCTDVICFDLEDSNRQAYQPIYIVRPDTTPEEVWDTANFTEGTNTALFLSWVPKDNDSKAFCKIVAQSPASELILIGDSSACGGTEFQKTLEESRFTKVEFQEILPRWLGWFDCITVYRKS